MSEPTKDAYGEEEEDLNVDTDPALLNKVPKDADPVAPRSEYDEDEEDDDEDDADTNNAASHREGATEGMFGSNYDNVGDAGPETDPD